MFKYYYSKIIVIVIVFFIFNCTMLFSKPYKSDVVVSYYADDFHGKKTSNGEIFNMYSLTCAHKTLPFDTVLMVTNRSNGKSVKVRVNDRGPFVANREADLSKAAAVKLDMIKSGIARVDIQIVKMGPDTKLSRETAVQAVKIMEKKGLWKKSTNSSTVKNKTEEKKENKKSNKVKQSAPVSDSNNNIYKAGTFWDIQVGAYSKRENANKLANSLSKKGFKNIVFQKTSEVFRVVIKNVPAEKVKETEERLKHCGYSHVIIRQRLN